MQFDKPIDPRLDLQRGYISWDLFRRKQLENICRLEGIYVRDGATHDEMKILLMNNGVDSKKYANIVFLGQLHGDGRDPRTENLHKEVQQMEKPIRKVIEDVNFQKMKMFELRQECSLQGIPWEKTDKKVELLKKIEDKLRGNAASGR